MDASLSEIQPGSHRSAMMTLVLVREILLSLVLKHRLFDGWWFHLGFRQA
jgi:hypothetical protein